MSSEEEDRDFGVFTDKLLKKSKRTRQRVDAGEPRNSYSSIPNFSSRPAFLQGSGNLYGAIFTQQQQFGLFGPGFAPKMLNELLGRQKGDEPEDIMRCDGSSPPASEQLAHHMLRDILQGRKHELLALEHEMRNGQDHINNNNNENIVSKTDSTENSNSNSASATENKECAPSTNPNTENSSNTVPTQQVPLPVQNQDSLLMDDVCNGMETESLPSPKAEPASPAKPEDAKKARVENIVSGMRSSPAPPQVNGCKKRKLYQPQQHDSTAERYLDEDDEEQEPIQRKRVEKNALKSQLRTMQEQLAEMQQKYVQLCTRMEQNSDESQCEVEEIPSDSEQETSKRSSPPSPVPVVSQVPTQQTLTQQVSKLKISPSIPTSVYPQNGLMHEHPHISNAAAMYLGVSHKLLMEQEVRMAKEAAAQAHAEAQHHHQQQQQMLHNGHHPHMNIPNNATTNTNQSNNNNSTSKIPMMNSSGASENIAERLSHMRSMTTPTGTDLEGLADALKSEITSSLSNLIDSIVTRFLNQKRCKQTEATAAAEQLNKDLLMASQLLDRKSPRTKVAERPNAPNPHGNPMAGQMVNGHSSLMPMQAQMGQKPDLHVRPAMFQPPKPPGISQAALYSMNHPFCVSKENPEQNEALSLVVTPKKKRHKVTDTRITPRTVSRILGQDGIGMSPGMEPQQCASPRPPPYHQPPPMLPVSLPTSVAIPNPGLHESQVFSPYSPFFHGPSHGHHMAMQVNIT